MSPSFPFLTGMVPPLIKERLRPELVSDPPPAMEVAAGRPLSPERLEEARRIFEVGRSVGIGNFTSRTNGSFNLVWSVYKPRVS